jgi:DNA-binding response OmpR family regulator
MVELHYGQISVSSEEGKGSAFVVTLPLGSEHLKPEEIFEEVSSDQLSVSSDQYSVISEQFSVTSDQLPATSIEEQASSQDVILVVEDNHEVRAFIRQQLEADYEVIEAVDGEAGFAKAAEAIPDLVVSDVMMPKMDGYAFCQALKREEKTSHIPVILLTAKAGQESKLEGLETGADDYLTKPFSSKELLARVRNLIEQRRRLRARFSREVILKPNEIAITPVDEQFLIRVKAAVEKNLGDEDFSVDDLGREVGMSRAQLHRKLKALTDQSAGQFILSMRLQRAIELMKQNAGTVAEIAYMTGFNTPNYFAKCFRKQFGCSPSEYKMNIAQEIS